MTLRNYTQMQCWQDSRLLFREMYVLFKESSALKIEFALKDQITRASLSIMNNIAEGFGRFSNKEFLRFLNIARGSCYEVESMIHAMLEVELINHTQSIVLFDLTNKIRRGLGALAKTLHNSISK